ncbi:MAG: sugar phosphate isomerase/epimerase family protein [Anaerolineaceae bacterium]
MNKVGIYYAFWTHEWDVDFHPYVDKVADLGFDILEINAGTFANMTSADRISLKKHADERDLDLTYCIGLPAEYDVASKDPSTRQNGIAFLQAQAKGIGEVGGGQVSGILYSSWPALMPKGETDKRPYLENSLNSMRIAIKAAEENNVIFNMEVVNRFEQYLLNTAAEAVAYVEAVNSPNIKILLDTYHMNIEEDHISTAIETADKHLGHVHIGENNRRPPGYGHIPWDELVTSLNKIDYKGGLVMEPFLMPGGQVGSDIRVWRDMSIDVDLDFEAAKALQFMRGKLESAN